MISEGSCDTEDWSNDAELHFKMCSNRKQLFFVKIFNTSVPLTSEMMATPLYVYIYTVYKTSPNSIELKVTSHIIILEKIKY